MAIDASGSRWRRKACGKDRAARLGSGECAQAFSGRDRPGRRVCSRGVVRALVTTLALFLQSPDSGGAEPGPSVKDFVHTVLTAKEGAPADVWAIAQTDDGWLWFGGRDGLARFDGVRFVRVDLAAPDTRMPKAVSALYALRSGGLAIAQLGGGIRLLRAGKATLFDTPETRAVGTVVDFAEGRDGILWATANNGLLRFDGRRWETVAGDWNFPAGGAFSAITDADDALWVSTDRDILRLPAGAHRFEPSGVPFKLAAEFAQTRDGRIWYSDDDTTRLLPGQPLVPTARTDASRKSYGALFDRDGHYWNVVKPPVGDGPGAVVRDMQTIGFLKTVFEDHEGNVWITEPSALVHRFRRPSIERTPTPGLAFEGTWPMTNIALDSHDELWIVTTLSGFAMYPTDGVWAIHDAPRHVQTDEIRSATAIARDPSGTVWVGGRNGVWKLQEGRFRKAIEASSGIGDGYVLGLTVDCSGGVWQSVVGTGLMRYDGAVWQPGGNVHNLPSQPTRSQACDPRGRLWLGYADGTVVYVDEGRAVSVPAADGPGVGMVTAIQAGRHTVIGGERGLALLRDGRFVSLSVNMRALEDVTTIVELADGDLWVNGARGVAHIAASELDNAASPDGIPVRVDLFDESDGYPGPAFNLAGPRTTMAVTTRGLIRLAGGGGLATIDPRDLRVDLAAPPIVIESIDAGGRRQDVVENLELSEGTRNLEIDYTALNYSHPERIRFRYRLDGVDDGWVDAAARRQAFYANLGPGTYRFVVNATNVNGTWTDRSASLDFVIPPTFVQSRAFIALCIVTVLLLLTFAYRVNMRRLEARQRRLLEERVGERERIARELHDTLLQGTQALIFNLHVAIGAIPEDSAARPKLSDALKNAEAAMTDGRDRIQDLRGGPETIDALEQSLADEGAQLARDRGTDFRIVVEGRERPVASTVVEIAYRIVREAMLNAFRTPRRVRSRSTSATSTTRCGCASSTTASASS